MSVFAGGIRSWKWKERQANRRFVKQVAGATAGAFLGGRGLADAGARFLQAGGAAPKRREVSVGGRRIKTVDLHCHCMVAEVTDVVKSSKLADTVKGLVSGPLVLGPERLRAMDQQGVDVEAVSINAFWYSADRELARQIIKVQNEELAEWCAAHPDRFVALASVALQYPDLAAEQLDEAVKKLGLRGVAIVLAASKARSCRRASSIRSGPRSRSWTSSRSCIRRALRHDGKPAAGRERAAWATPSEIRWRPPCFSRT